MQKRITSKSALYAFDSLAELARFIDTAPHTWGRLHTSSLERPGEAWDLSLGYASAVKLARDGWPEGAQKAQETLKAFTPRTPALALRTDFYGHMPHVPRYCAGAPDSMIRHHKEPTIGNGRVLTLYVPITANCTTSAKHMSNFGLGVAQYINQLESDGLRVELYGVIGSELRSMRAYFSFCIKSADQPLDLAVLAFAIGHPAMLRRLGLALFERSAAPPQPGYGHASRLEMSDLIEPGNGAVILNGMNDAGNCARTPKAALEYITKEIEAAIEQREGVL